MPRSTWGPFPSGCWFCCTRLWRPACGGRFVRLLFRPEEKRSVPDAEFVMTPPETLRSLIHINVRRRVGVDEMAERHAAGPGRPQPIGRGKPSRGAHDCVAHLRARYEVTI